MEKPWATVQTEMLVKTVNFIAVSASHITPYIILVNLIKK